MAYLDKRLSKGMKLSEYREIKKTLNDIENHDIIKYALAGSGIANLDIAGAKIMGMARGVAYWIVAVVAVLQIIRAIIDGNKQKVMEILINAGIAYGSLFFVTFILDLIKETLA